MSSSSANRRELDSVLSDDIDTELAIWKHLVFDAGMAPPHQNHRDEDHPAIPPQYSQTSHTSPPQLPPETYTYLIQALLSLQGSAYPHSHPPPSPYPTLPNHNYHWPSAPIAGPSSFYPFPPHVAQQGTSSSQLTPSLAASPTTAQDLEETEDAVSITEDKRRRNTAASARFRVKKKLKTLNLERTVADLTGRTEELERDAADLRRENAWLKEIVLLRGRNLALNLGPQALASANRHDEDDEDEDEGNPAQTKSGVEKGKEKEK